MICMHAWIYVWVCYMQRILSFNDYTVGVLLAVLASPFPLSLSLFLSLSPSLSLSLSLSLSFCHIMSTCTYTLATVSIYLLITIKPLFTLSLSLSLLCNSSPPPPFLPRLLICLVVEFCLRGRMGHGFPCGLRTCLLSEESSLWASRGMGSKMLFEFQILFS